MRELYASLRESMLPTLKALLSRVVWWRKREMSPTYAAELRKLLWRFAGIGFIATNTEMRFIGKARRDFPKEFKAISLEIYEKRRKAMDDDKGAN